MSAVTLTLAGIGAFVAAHVIYDYIDECLWRRMMRARFGELRCLR